MPHDRSVDLYLAGAGRPLFLTPDLATLSSLAEVAGLEAMFRDGDAAVAGVSRAAESVATTAGRASWRLGPGTKSLLVGAMIERGMIANRRVVSGVSVDPREHGYECAPNFPVSADVELPDDVWFDPVAVEGRAGSYLAAIRERLSTGSPDAGIPVWKLASGEDWLVTAAECRSALSCLDLWCRAEEGRDRNTATWYGLDVGAWPEWLEWLERAGDGGGFVVR